MVKGVLYRTATQADLPFIFSSWLDSYANSSPLTVNILKSVFHREHRKVIDRLLREEAIQVVVICLDDDPNVICGFLVFEQDPEILHYAYIKSAFRRLGIMTGAFKMLGVDAGKTTCTHWTYLLSQLKPKWPKLIFNPYLLKDRANGTPDPRDHSPPGKA